MLLNNYKPSIYVKSFVIAIMSLSFICVVIAMIGFNILRDQYVMINCILDLIIMAILLMMVICCIEEENVFINYMIALYATVFAGALGSVLVGFPKARSAILFLYTLSYVFTGISQTLFGLTLASLVPNQKPSFTFSIAAVLFGALYIIAAIHNCFSGIFFTVNEAGRIIYRNYDAPRTFCLLGVLVFFVSYIARAKCDKKLKLSLFASAIFPMIACVSNIAWVVSGLNYEIESFTNISYIFSALMIFVNVYQRNIATISEQEANLTKARVNLLVSQIHPHFISNTLGMIRGMYREDAASAEKAMNTFISYLQKNFSDISNNMPISADKEIEHVKDFIELELMRWPDMSVEYDIKTTAFEIPSMTLQPLVENAITHGLMPLESGGTIKISTAEKSREFIITVSDNGVGIKKSMEKNLERRIKSQEKARRHIGLSNVEERLNKMCGGYLEIKSEEMNGTAVTVHIPKGE